MLVALASGLPIEAIYSDFSHTPKLMRNSEKSEVELRVLLDQLKILLPKLGKDKFRRIVLDMNLIDGNVEYLDIYIEEYWNDC